MYGIIHWVNDEYVTFIHNANGSIRIFTLQEADAFANSQPDSENMRVVSLDGVTD